MTEIDDNLQPPQKSGGDTAHMVGKAGLSAIPVAGGPVAELIAFLIEPPLSKRQTGGGIDSVGKAK